MNKLLLKVGVIEALGCALPNHLCESGNELKVYGILRDKDFLQEMLLSTTDSGLVNVYTDDSMSELIGTSECWIDGESMMIKQMNNVSNKEYAAIYEVELIENSGIHNGIGYNLLAKNPKLYGVYPIDNVDKNHSI